MKTFRILLFTVLCSLFTNEACAQDAFYIYQNDGHFDGFFYDQVESINYSKIDTLGRECLDYVVQEIVTRDSTYRIMLSAIDSVSFVQPEIKLNPLMRKMDDLGQTDYFDHIDEQGDNVTLYFKGTMPDNLMPKVDEVLTGFDEDVYGPDGYLGKVAAVSKSGGYVVCQMKPIEKFSDLFDQFITVEQVGYDSQGNLARRIAGLNEASFARSAMPRRDKEGTYNLKFINWSGRLQYEDSVAPNKKWNFGVDVVADAGMTVVYQFTDKRVYLKETIAAEFSLSPSFHFIWSSAPCEIPLPSKIPLPAIKFPAVLPVFEAGPKIESMIKMGLQADFGIKMGTIKFPFELSYVIDTDSKEFVKGGFVKKKSDDNSKWFEWDVDASLVMNGFIHLGNKVTFELSTNRWIDKWFLASIGWEIFTGPKFEGEISLSTAGMIQNGAYGLLKDSRVGMTLLCIESEAKAKIMYVDFEGLQIKDVHEIEKSFWSDTQKFISRDWYAFPDFEDSEAEFDQQAGIVKASVFPRRETCVPVDVGVGLYDSNDNRVYEYFRGEDYCFWNEYYNEVSHNFAAEGLPSDVYNVVPLVKLWGIVMPVKEKAVEVEVINNKLEVTPMTHSIGPESVSVESEIETSAETISLKSSDESWLSATRHGYLIRMTAQALPEDKPVRSGSVFVDATFPDKTTKQIRIDIIQSRAPGDPIVVLTPDSLTFSSAAERQTAQLTSNTKMIECTPSDTWIHPTIINNTLTVDVDPSTLATERKGTVNVTANLNGKQAVTQLKVTQRAPLTITQRDLMFTAEGGTKQVTVILGGDFAVSAKPEADWLKASYSDGKLSVTAEENFETKPRNSKVKVAIMIDNQEVAVELNVTQRAYIVLTPNVIECDKKGGVFLVDIETDLTNVTIDAVMDWVGLAISSDRKRLTVSVEPNETGRDRQGSGLVSARKSDGTIISSSIIVKQSGDEQAPPTSLVMQEITSSKITPDPDGCNKTIYITCKDWPGMEGQTYVYEGEWIIAYNGLTKNDMYEDIFDAFRHNDVIPRNDDGTFALKTKELTLSGKFDDETNVSATGTFSIDASFFHQRKTVAEAERLIREGGDVESLNMLLNATISHQITGTFTCQWNDETQLYDFHFTGSGPFQISGTYFNQMTGSWQIAGYPLVPHPDAVITGTAAFSDEGTTTVDITVSYLWQE